jgi:hypothetical protein
MGTTQSVVAHQESGKRPPSMRTVERFAQAGRVSGVPYRATGDRLTV